MIDAQRISELEAQLAAERAANCKMREALASIAEKDMHVADDFYYCECCASENTHEPFCVIGIAQRALATPGACQHQQRVAELMVSIVQLEAALKWFDDELKKRRQVSLRRIEATPDAIYSLWMAAVAPARQESILAQHDAAVAAAARRKALEEVAPTCALAADRLSHHEDYPEDEQLVARLRALSQKGGE